jgi:flagellar hook-length control protein FliK
LGKLQIEIQIRENRLYGRFKTADPLIGEYLEENLPRLADRLGAGGYLANLEIRVVASDQLQEILPARLEGFPDSLLSLVV